MNNLKHKGDNDMVKWIYTLKSGAILKKLIELGSSKENMIDIIHQLQKCYKEILERYPFKEEDEGDKYEIEESYNLLDGDDDIIAAGSFEEYGFNDGEELIDERLEEFYDHCDWLRIWIGD